MMRILTLWSLVLVSITGISQPSAFNFSIEEGLPSNEVYNAFQDSKGFLWFGTDNGVVRYDGRQFDLYHVRDGLTDPVVFDMFEDYRGRIWFRTYSGKVCYYEDGRILPYRYNHELSVVVGRQILRQLYYDSLERLWFAASKVVGHIDSAGNLDTVSVQRGEMAAFRTDQKMLLAYFGVENTTTFKFQGRSFPVPRAPAENFYHMPRALFWNDLFYFSINDKLYSFDGSRVKLEKAAHHAIVHMVVDPNNNLWLCYIKGGAERFVKNLETPDLTLFPGKSVTSIAFDHEQSIWVTTLENGIYFVPHLDISYDTRFGDARITAVARYDNDLFVGNGTGEVKAYDLTTGKLHWQLDLDDIVFAFVKQPGGNTWISTAFQLYIRQGPDKVVPFHSIGRSAMALHDDGSVLSANVNLYKISPQLKILRALRADDNHYRSMLVSDTLVFLAGRSGLHVYDDDFNLLRKDPAFENVKILHMQELNDSILFLGSLGNGFFLLNKKDWTVSQFNSRQRFLADNIYSVMRKDSLLWLSTDKGIAVSSVESIVNRKFNFSFLTKWSGLIDHRINFLIDGGSHLLAFSDYGCSRIPYDEMRFANKHPLFVLESLSINDNRTKRPRQLTLDHNQNNIAIEYRSISFNNRSFLTRFRITPAEPWNYSDSRQLLFSSLAPGKYSFELEYSNDNDRWYRALDPINITIQPAWWNRWYSRLAAFIIILGAAFAYFKYQWNIYKERNQYLKIINGHQQKLLQSEITTRERERNRISKELHDRVGTNLTAIKLAVTQLLKGYGDPGAEAAEEQLQLTIREIKDIIYGLTPPSLERYGLFTGLRNYVGKLSQSIPITITLKTYGSDPRDFDVSIMVFRILQELIANTAKHAFASNIMIHINAFEDMLSIVYEDDGVGFSFDPENHGLGLDNIESRIQSMNGTLRFESGSFGVSYSIDIPMTTKKEVV